jgi:hypothetical protein
MTRGSGETEKRRGKQRTEKSEKLLEVGDNIE